MIYSKINLVYRCVAIALGDHNNHMVMNLCNTEIPKVDYNLLMYTSVNEAVKEFSGFRLL